LNGPIFFKYPQSKYVSGHRQQSDAAKALLTQFEAALNGYTSDDYHNSTERIFYRLFCNTSFPANYTEARIVKSDRKHAGSMEDFYKIVFDTPEATQQPEQPNFTPVEITAGEVSIVDYSEKAFAVIGTPEDLKSLQPKMYELGGKYNKYLKCGAGYIFSKKKLDEVTKALSEETTEPTQSANIEEAKAGEKDEVKKMIEFFAETDIKNNGFISEGTKQAAAVQNVSLIYAETIPQNCKVIPFFNSQSVSHV